MYYSTHTSNSPHLEVQHKSWAAVSLTEFSVPLINPCLISTIDLTNVPDTSASTSEHPTTTIIVHSAPTPAGHPSLCFFEYHLNLGPITLGWWVALHPRAADYFDPSPSLSPVAEGWLERIAYQSPNWLTFLIVDLEGREVALLSIPYASSVWCSAGLQLSPLPILCYYDYFPYESNDLTNSSRQSVAISPHFFL